METQPRVLLRPADVEERRSIEERCSREERRSCEASLSMRRPSRRRAANQASLEMLVEFRSMEGGWHASPKEIIYEDTAESFEANEASANPEA
jgi:hypothetical protein